MLKYLPQHGIAAEIGVAVGEYSEHLLNGLTPRTLHLIDPWRFQNVPDYLTDANNTKDEEGDRRYKGVLKKFAPQIANGIVEVHRATSTEVVDSFPDEYFDFVFIDAVHTYNGCLNDLRAFDKKVKRNGFIAGHDYQTIPVARAEHNAVIQAVHHFVIETEYTFLALTFEEAPSYVIAKDPNSRPTIDFITNCARNHLVMAQIANAEHKVFEQIEVPFAPQKYIFSFD
jgi:hypothetical protein